MPDIFDGTAPESNPVANDLIGEGKKFKDVDALARGKVEADAFIERLKAEKAEVERRLTESTNAEAELARLREEMAELRKAQTKVDPHVQPAASASDIEAVVEATITRAEQRRTEAGNIKEANRVMVEALGTPEKAAEVVVRRAEELNLSVPELKALAAKSPSAFKRIVLGDAEVVPTGVDLQRSTVNPETLPKTGNRAGTKEFYQELLRTNPKRYHDPATQRQILKDTIAGTYVP